MVRLVALLGCMFILAPGGAFAAEENGNHRSGIFASITGLAAFNTDDDGQKRDSETGGFDVSVGVQNQKRAFGFRGSWLEDNTQLSIGFDGRIYPLGYMGLHEPGTHIFDALRPYLGFGIGLVNTEFKDDGSERHRWSAEFRYSLGADFFVTERIAITANGEFRQGTGGLHEVDSVVAGIGIKLVGF